MVAQWLCVCLQDACWVSRVVGVTCLSQGWPRLSLWLIPWAADRLWEWEAADPWIRKVMGRGGWGSLEEWIWPKSPKRVVLCIRDGVCSSLSHNLCYVILCLVHINVPILHTVTIKKWFDLFGNMPSCFFIYTFKSQIFASKGFTFLMDRVRRYTTLVCAVQYEAEARRHLA